MNIIFDFVSYGVGLWFSLKFSFDFIFVSSILSLIINIMSKRCAKNN